MKGREGACSFVVREGLVAGATVLVLLRATASELPPGAGREARSANETGQGAGSNEAYSTFWITSFLLSVHPPQSFWKALKTTSIEVGVRTQVSSKASAG